MIPRLTFVLRRRWPILLLLPIVAVVLVVLLTPPSNNRPPVYRSTIFLIGQRGQDQLGVTELEQAVLQIQQLPVALEVTKALGRPVEDVEDVQESLDARVNEDSVTLEISVTDLEESVPTGVVDAYATEFIRLTSEAQQEDVIKELERAQADRDRAQLELTAFQEEFAEEISGPVNNPIVKAQEDTLKTALSGASARVNDLNSALTNNAVSYRVLGREGPEKELPNKLQLPQNRAIRAIMAYFIALLGTIALVAVIEKLYRRIDDPKQAEDILGVPVLGMIPVVGRRHRKRLERADLETFSGPFAEAFRAVRSHLDFRRTLMEDDRPPRVMLVSAAPSEGKTTSAAFLALAYLEAGQEVVVIGADFRRPMIHRLFGIPRIPGLASRVIHDGTPPPLSELVLRDGKTGASVVPSGPGSDRVTGLLPDLVAISEAATAAGRTIIMDTAPIMVANDAIEFLPAVDWVIVVVRIGKTTERGLRQSLVNLQLNDATVIGCMMVGSLESSDSKRYYYSYYNSDAKVTPSQLEAREKDRAFLETRLNGSRTPGSGEAPAEDAEPVATSETPT